MTDETTVTRNDERSRYEIHVGGRLGGFLVLEEHEDGSVEIPHTEVDGEFTGMGLGSRLAGEALADLARRGETVTPTCPFVKHYLRDNDVPGLTVDWPRTDEAADSAAPAEPA